MGAIRVAEASDIPMLAETLTLAFDDDPALSWVMRTDDKREEALRRLITYFLRDSIPYGEVRATEELDACAVWVPPGVWAKRPGVLESLRMLPETLRWTGWRRLRHFMDLDAAEYANRPGEPHFYLAFLGIRPDRQRMGLGSALLGHTLRRLDEMGLPAYLENSNPVNLSLYLRHGFRVVNEITQHGGPSEWGMWRDSPIQVN
jgi:ribosomal protein S18 acetylase RimI-like enzyme